MEEMFPKLRRRSLLEHFAEIKDSREPCKVMYPLPEILFLVVCATIAGCEDYDEIADWGEAHIDFLRRSYPYFWGIPCEDWLRKVMNRLDPKLFADCFTSWVEEWRPGAIDLVAIDGKTSRRSHDRGNGKKALHLVSAWASRERLVLGQQAVDEKSNEIIAIPELLGRLNIKGALVTIDAIACQSAIAEKIVDAGANYLLAVKGNQPTLYEEIASYFETAPVEEIETVEDVDKDHGRLETRRVVVSKAIDWMAGDNRFKGLTAIAMIETTVEKAGKISADRRYYISSEALSAARCAAAARSHWGIENQLHWVLDVQFKEDQSRLRAGHGAKNMAVVRHFALNIVRNATDKRSIKTRRKRAGWDVEYLNSLIQPTVLTNC